MLLLREDDFFKTNCGFDVFFNILCFTKRNFAMAVAKEYLFEEDDMVIGMLGKAIDLAVCWPSN